MCISRGPSVSLSVAMPKVDPRFGTGEHAREQMGIHLFGGGGHWEGGRAALGIIIITTANKSLLPLEVGRIVKR